MHFFVTAKLFLIFLQKSKKYRHKFTTLFPNILFYILFCLQREMLLFCMQAGARIVAVSVFVFVSVEESSPQDTMLCFLLFAGIIFNTRAGFGLVNCVLLFAIVWVESSFKDNLYWRISDDAVE